MAEPANRTNPITIALGGDTMLGRGVGLELAKRAPDELWAPDLRDVFGEADVAIVNLECCISERGRPWDQGNKPFHFRAPPAAVEVLGAAGIRAVWLANNHALDYGPDALLDTFDHLREGGIEWAGAGPDRAAARTGAVIEVAGYRIGLLGFADHPSDYAAAPDRPGIAWTPLEIAGVPDWLVAEVRRLRATCDLVIAGPHWGPNMTQRPAAHHRPSAVELVAAGLDLLAGHSAHVPQPIEVVDGAPICYDVGDLLDDYAIDPFLRNDLSVLVLWRPGEWLELVPLKLEYARTTLARGEDRDWMIDRMRRAADEMGTELQPTGGRLRLSLRMGAASAKM